MYRPSVLLINKENLHFPRISDSGYSFFNRTACAVGGGLFLGGYVVLFIAALHIGAFMSPWLFLTAAPFFIMGTKLGYSAGDTLPRNAFIRKS